MLEAYGALFGWKLSLHGIKAGATKKRVGDSYFKAIAGKKQ